MQLINRTAVITGASRGLGAAIAERFVAEGASVILCARSEAELDRVAEKLFKKATSKQKIFVKKINIAKFSQIDELFLWIRSEFSSIEILVNNAGIYGPVGLLDEVAWEEWIEAIQVNLLGSVYFCRAVLPLFKEKKYGKIINLSGGGATNPLPRLSAYAASKAALVRLVETLALEVADFNIDVNAMAPGYLATELNQKLLELGPEKLGHDFYSKMLSAYQSGGTPLEVAANLAVYLASAMSDGLSGKLISAVWDSWVGFGDHLDKLKNSDVYTLRRIVPGDRDLILE